MNTRISYVLFCASLLSLNLVACSDDDNESGTSDNETGGLIHVRGTVVKGSDSYKLWGSEDHQGVFIEGQTIAVKDFYISPYEVTKNEYKTIMSDPELNTLGLTADPAYSTLNPDKYPVTSGENDGKRPVENVTWYDAAYFCNLLSVRDGFDEVYSLADVKTGKSKVNGVEVVQIVSATVSQDITKNGYRMPTEVEWEFAARGGDPSSEVWNFAYSGGASECDGVPLAQKPYNGVDTGLDKVGWYKHNSDTKTHQVGLLAPNALGLYDMSGNVNEWCTDVAHEQYALDGKYYDYAKDRGGCYSFNAQYNTVAYRGKFKLDLCYQYLGFRLARTK